MYSIDIFPGLVIVPLYCDHTIQLRHVLWLLLLLLLLRVYLSTNPSPCPCESLLPGG